MAALSFLSAVETRLATMIFHGFLRFSAQRLFQLPGTPAARLLLTESPRVGKGNVRRDRRRFLVFEDRWQSSVVEFQDREGGAARVRERLE